MNAKKKIIPIFIFVLIILLLSWLFLGGTECIALKLKKQDAVKGITVTGNIESTEDTKITTDITAKIEQIYVKSGDFVKEGQILAYLEREAAQGRVKAARGKLESARADLEDLKTEPREQEIEIAKAKITESIEKINSLKREEKKIGVQLKDAISNEKRYRKLHQEGAVSLRELEEKTLKKEELEELIEQSRREIKAVESQLEQMRENLSLTIEKIKKEEIESAKGRVLEAQGDLSAAVGDLESYVIKAPMSGFITDKYVSTGDIASPEKPLFRLVVPEDIYLSVDVEENELDSVKVGQKSVIIFDAYPQRTFEGFLYMISKQVDPLTGTFESRITVPDADDMLFLVGMTLDAVIIAEEFFDILIIPGDFIETENDKSYVFKKQGFFAVKTPVEVDFFDNNRAKVIKGVKKGNIILKKMGTGKLSHNQRIKIKEFIKQ